MRQRINDCDSSIAIQSSFDCEISASSQDGILSDPGLRFSKSTESVHYHPSYGCYRSSGASCHGCFEQNCIPRQPPPPTIISLLVFLHGFMFSIIPQLHLLFICKVHQYHTWKPLRHWNLNIVVIVVQRKSFVSNSGFLEKLLFPITRSIRLLPMKLSNILLLLMVVILAILRFVHQQEWVLFFSFPCSYNFLLGLSDITPYF